MAWFISSALLSVTIVTFFPNDSNMDAIAMAPGGPSVSSGGLRRNTNKCHWLNGTDVRYCQYFLFQQIRHYMWLQIFHTFSTVHPWDHALHYFPLHTSPDLSLHLLRASICYEALFTSEQAEHQLQAMYLWQDHCSPEKKLQVTYNKNLDTSEILYNNSAIISSQICIKLNIGNHIQPWKGGNY